MKIFYFSLALFILFFISGTSHAQSGPDDEGTIFYTDPDSPFPDTGSDRSKCLARSVVVDIRCFVAPIGLGKPWGCGFSRAETYCNWGTQDVYCCKTQQQIDSLRQRVYARACQKAVYEGNCPSHNTNLFWCREYNEYGWEIGPAHCF